MRLVTAACLSTLVGWSSATPTSEDNHCCRRQTRSGFGSLCLRDICQYRRLLKCELLQHCTGKVTLYGKDSIQCGELVRETVWAAICGGTAGPGIDGGLGQQPHHTGTSYSRTRYESTTLHAHLELA